HSQTIRSSLLLLFLSVHNKPYTNWELDIMSNAKTKLGITKYSIVTNSNDSVTLRLMTESRRLCYKFQPHLLRLPPAELVPGGTVL
ncbi:hypothetical protein RVM25_36860, partial [Enterobacter hormaechei subsp. xiangfangensis]